MLPADLSRRRFLTLSGSGTVVVKAGGGAISWIDGVEEGHITLDSDRPQYHVPLTGGARMGTDPRTSVVGMDHRVHGMDNLFVADPSVFPTAPSVDPSLTIMAFSSIAAEHVKATV